MTNNIIDEFFSFLWFACFHLIVESSTSRHRPTCHSMPSVREPYEQETAEQNREQIFLFKSRKYIQHPSPINFTHQQQTYPKI
jgi:hypothetical protein